MKFILPIFKKVTNTQLILITAFSIGFSSAISQFIFIREFISFFLGSELIIGITLASWLLITGLGSFKYSIKDKTIYRCIIFFSIFPILTVLIIRLLKLTLITILDLGTVSLICVILLFPFCFLSGFLIRSLVEKLSLNGVRTISFIDTIGGITGGIIFTFFFSQYLSPFNTLFILCLLNLLIATFFVLRKFSLAIFSTVLLVIILFCYNIEKRTIEWFLPSQKLVENLYTPHGSIHVFKDESQYNIFQNGVFIGSTNDLISRESIAHFGVVQHQNPKKVLLISGGIVGAFLELNKYNTIEVIDYVETDKSIINLASKFHGIPKKVKTYYSDPRKFLSDRKKSYDAIISSVSDPTSLDLNRFFTVEFFSLVKNALKANGVFSFRIMGHENYISKEFEFLSASIVNAAKKYFKNVIVIPGPNSYVIASDNKLSYDFKSLLSRKNIKTEFFKDTYLSAFITKDRIEKVLNFLSLKVKLNSDFSPIASYASFKYWLTHFDIGLMPLVGLFIFILAMLIKLIVSSNNRAVSFSLSTTAFSTISFQIIVMMSFQIFFGSLYKELSLFITTFFLGFAIGNYSIKYGVHFFFYEIFLALLILSYSIIVNIAPFLLIKPVLIFYNFFSGFIGGIQLVIAASFFNSEKGRVFSFDFIGASLGAFSCGVLIAGLGVTPLCIMLAFIKLVSASIFYIKGEKRFYSKDYFFDYYYFFLLVLFLLEGVLILSGDTGSKIYGFTFSSLYQWGAVLFLGLAIIISIDIFPAFKKYYSKKIFSFPLIRLFYFVVFSLIAFFPIFKCYFKIPYIFCHVCPRKCVFGFFRPYVIPAIIIMNLNKKSWCINMCPIGTLNESRGGLATPKNVFILTSTLVGIFIFYSYFKIKADLDLETLNHFDWYSFFFKNAYSSHSLVLIFALIFLFLSFFIKRFFCKAICPLWLISESERKLESIFPKNEEKESISIIKEK